MKTLRSGTQYWIKPSPANYYVLSSYDRLFFTWNGGNVSKVDHFITNNDGTGDTSFYNYEYSDYINPFRGIPLHLLPYTTFGFSTNCIDGVNKNLVSGCYNDISNKTFEFTTKNGRVVGIHAATTIAHPDIPNKQLLFADYELEYDN